MKRAQSCPTGRCCRLLPLLVMSFWLGLGQAAEQPWLLALRAQSDAAPPETSSLLPADRKLVIPFVAKPPVFGGILNEEWNAAEVCCGFNTTTGLAPSETIAYVCRDQANLYIAFHCTLTPGASPLSRSVTRNNNVWQDESVEVFIDPGRTKKEYYHFIVNTLNTQQDGKGFVAGVNGQWISHTRVEKDFWEAELSIPFATLGVNSPQVTDTWGINFDRNDRRHGGEHSSFSHLTVSAHDPTHFCPATFGALPPFAVRFARASVPQRGDGTIQVLCVNHSPEKKTASVVLKSEGIMSLKTSPLVVEVPPLSHLLQEIKVQYDGLGSAVLRLNIEGDTAAGETATICVVRPLPIKLLAAERESYLSEQTLRVGVRSELAALDTMRLELTLSPSGQQTNLRSFLCTGLPSVQSAATLFVGGLEPGPYTVRARILSAKGATLGEDGIEFVRSKGPFDEQAEVK